ncbi:enterotoxin A family protein [Bartonella doshiae]|uniref:Heat-labile enterotoxin IIB, A chain n=2 Tax=Bartonella doshiae TaxID=33044 RepID=A0A380ZCG0_BARDO|nr:enterotoxin A family protein [Bartonella doshiae]EJF79605.1 hypothetical protein MCS_01332 [Bartonella doshiae NCTC 12862 = ATCC 700133]MBB6160036.1 cholera enterotoxin subunit A [Bartonella doshiae]SUV44361.1 Heat-labile enterotoxin IIB, A chain precursor [Bartonella doshiae]
MFKLFITIIIVVFSQHVFANDNDNNTVYRAVMQSPKEVKRDGGFLPRGMDGTRPNQPPPDISLWNHVHGTATGMSRYNSGYVSTTRYYPIAANWVYDYLNHDGYIYHIRVTPNFIDVNASLGRFSPYEHEREVAALGVIHWEQIIGWQRSSGGVVGPFVRNPDYREQLYAGLTSGGAQPQLAAFPVEHQAWNLVPWVTYAHCQLRSSCSPIKSAQIFGTEWFWKSYYTILATPFIYLD